MAGKRGEITQADIELALDTNAHEVQRLLGVNRSSVMYNLGDQQDMTTVMREIGRERITMASKMLMEMIEAGTAPVSVMTALGLFGPRA